MFYVFIQYSFVWDIHLCKGNPFVCITSGIGPECKQDSAVLSVTLKTTLNRMHQKHENVRWWIISLIFSIILPGV